MFLAACFPPRLVKPQQLCMFSLALVACLCGASNTRAGSQPAPPSAPRAVVALANVDLGTVAKGDVVNHNFEIKNEGDAPLLLVDSNSSCGCAVLDWDQEVAPGESGVVRARIDTRTVSGPALTSVRVSTNDPKNAELELTLSINVETLVGMYPPRARWDTVQGETRGTIGVTVFALDANPLAVTAVDVANPDIAASFRKATGAERVASASGEQWRIELTLGDTPTIGAIEGFATISLEHAKQKRTFIPVSGFVRPLIHVAPEVTDLGRIVLQGKARHARYQVRNFGTKPMAIERIEVQGIEGATAVFEERTAGHIYDVLLRFDPATASAGEFVGRMVVHTDLERHPAIEIAVSGTVVVR